MTDNLFCNLTINQFELPVYLGWPHDERHDVQMISMDIHINFRNVPLACTTDRLEDTICYWWLTDEIRKKISNQSFRLIEHLTHTIYTLVQELIPSASMISVNLTKKPAIPGLNGGVTFSCVNFTEGSMT